MSLVNERHCELCEDDGADTFCRDCNYFFCAQCCEAVHDDPVRSHHALAKVSPGSSPVTPAAVGNSSGPTAVDGPHLTTPSITGVSPAPTVPETFRSPAAARTPPEDIRSLPRADLPQLPSSWGSAGVGGARCEDDKGGLPNRSDQTEPVGTPGVSTESDTAAEQVQSTFSFAKSQAYHARQGTVGGGLYASDRGVEISAGDMAARVAESYQVHSSAIGRGLYASDRGESLLSASRMSMSDIDAAAWTASGGLRGSYSASSFGPLRGTMDALTLDPKRVSRSDLVAAAWPWESCDSDAPLPAAQGEVAGSPASLHPAATKLSAALAGARPHPLGRSAGTSHAPTCGLGVRLRHSSRGTLTVAAILEGGSAYQSGMLLAGDTVLAVDGVDTAGRSIRQIAALFVGEEGSLAVLRVARAAPDDPSSLGSPFTVAVQRKAFLPPAPQTSPPEDAVQTPASLQQAPDSKSGLKSEISPSPAAMALLPPSQPSALSVNEPPAPESPDLSPDLPPSPASSPPSSAANANAPQPTPPHSPHLSPQMTAAPPTAEGAAKVASPRPSSGGSSSAGASPPGGASGSGSASGRSSRGSGQVPFAGAEAPAGSPSSMVAASSRGEHREQLSRGASLDGAARAQSERDPSPRDVRVELLKAPEEVQGADANPADRALSASRSDSSSSLGGRLRILQPSPTAPAEHASEPQLEGPVQQQPAPAPPASPAPGQVVKAGWLEKEAENSLRGGVRRRFCQAVRGELRYYGTEAEASSKDGTRVLLSPACKLRLDSARGGGQVLVVEVPGSRGYRFRHRDRRELFEWLQALTICQSIPPPPFPIASPHHSGRPPPPDPGQALSGEDATFGSLAAWGAGPTKPSNPKAAGGEANGEASGGEASGGEAEQSASSTVDLYDRDVGLAAPHTSAAGLSPSKQLGNSPARRLGHPAVSDAAASVHAS